jgi:hypothetical protein
MSTNNNSNNVVEASSSSVLSTSNIFKLMNSVGVSVKAVVLKTDGTIAEIDYDSTPRTNQAQAILAGFQPTIIGLLYCFMHFDFVLFFSFRTFSLFVF